MKKLTISRKRWLRGEGAGQSYLLRPDDKKMCCLGFYLRSCGVSAKEISGKGSPTEIKQLPKQAEWLSVELVEDPLRTSDSCGLLMTHNDNIGGKNKEAAIKELFASHKVDVTFVD